LNSVSNSNSSSPFSDGNRAGESAASAAASVEADFAGDEWCAEFLSVKALLPKIAALSETDFVAMNEILRYVRSLSSDEPFFTISRKLPALEGS